MRWYALRDAMSASRLFRRLFGLFVVAALIPLGVSAWLSTSAIDDIAQALNLRDREQSTRQMGRQVFDRLKAGKALLSTAVESLDSHVLRGADLPSGLGSVFARFAPVAASRGGEAGLDLAAAWERAQPATQLKPFGSKAGSVDIALRVLADGDRAARVMMGASRDGQLLGVAELRPGYLWAPLEDARPDSLWTVIDGERHTIVDMLGVDFAASGVRAETGAA
jgi:hypothetical protein